MYRAWGKRFLDLIFSTFFIFLLALPLVLVALLIKLDSKGPVLFRDRRAGKNLRPFIAYKFRTMTVEAPKNIPTNELKDANVYITKIGKILRKLSIDELPQLFNVLKGEMSIVGPRPVVLSETKLFKERAKYGVNELLPGITGWAQVNGRDELRIKKKARMDGVYVEKFGIIMDAKCILLTIWAVLSIKGHKEGCYFKDTFDASKNMIKKVLFTSHTANFSKFNRPFMRLLKSQGYEVHYASAGEEDVLDCDRHFKIPFTRAPFRSENFIAYKKLKKIIDEQNYSLIHTHTPMGSVVTRLAARKSRKQGTKVLYTAHGFHFFKGAPLINWLTYYIIEKFMAKHSDAVITINQEDFNRAKQNFATSVHYIPGVGVDLERFKPVHSPHRLELRKKYGYKNKDFILIYIAELNENKNQSFLINQIKLIKNEIPSIKLLLCGSGESDEKYKQLAKNLGVSKNIEFLGYRHDVEKLLALSDVAVSSSIREGLGVNLVEAMAVGLPIVASYNRGHKDLVKHGSNGFLFNTAHEFTNYINKLYKDETLRWKIRENNVAEVIKYSASQAEANMGNIYQEVIE